ncbi:MAG: hypothetical protein U0694_27795 [Anaerolineae bacterium]
MTEFRTRLHWQLVWCGASGTVLIAIGIAISVIAIVLRKGSDED